MRSARSGSTASKAPPPARTPWGRYWRATDQPLYALLFLFPLVAFYEFGSLLVRATPGPGEQLVAQSLVNHFLALFGAQAAWLPGVALILTLIIWHVLSRKPWHVEGWTLMGMLAESLVLSGPLLVITGMRLALAGDAPSVLPRQIVMAVGAGIFEELVFRLYLLTGVMLLLIDLVRAPRSVGIAIAAAASSILFALCHFDPIGAAPFSWGTFFVFLAAGVYLALIFVGRGFGVAVGCHAAHNVILLLLG